VISLAIIVISLAISNFVGAQCLKLTQGVLVNKAYSIYFYHVLIILKTTAAIITVGRIGRPLA
jgi:hypothetical protein